MHQEEIARRFDGRVQNVDGLLQPGADADVLTQVASVDEAMHLRAVVRIEIRRSIKLLSP